MPLKTNYTALIGGLDLVTGSVMVSPGALSHGVNFEQVFGKVGYRRIDGYERFDGHPEPHTAEFYSIDLKDGQTEILPGDLIVTGSGEGVVLSFTLESGTWAAGTAKGELIYGNVLGAFSSAQTLHKTTGGGPTVGTVDSNPVAYRPVSFNEDIEYRKTTQTARRSKIDKVPGSGPVRGVAVYKGAVYAFRDAVDGKSLTMWGSSASGWASIKTGLRPGGRYDCVVANFSGDADKLALFGVDGKNPPFKYDGTYTNIGSIFGSVGTSTDSETITGSGTLVFTVAETSRSWVNGEVLFVYADGDPGNWMLGSVTDYTSPNVTLTITSSGGSGTFSSWHLSKADGSDIPYLVTAHKDHLFLAFPRGQLQTSNLGDPMTYTTSAGLFGLGSEITGLVSLKGAMLGVFCEDKIMLLEGANKDDWALGLHAPGVGARAWTAQPNAGNALLMEERGLVSLQATQNFGFFEPAIWSRNVQPMLDSLKGSIVGSRMVRSKYQYRLYFADGRVLSACITNPSPAVRPNDVSFTVQQYDHSVSCVGEGQLNDEEVMFFGTTDGWVMREDVGQSFDGGPISAAIQTHFNHMKELGIKKRFRKIEIEASAEEEVEVKFLQIFDYDDGQFRRSIERAHTARGEGGVWDDAEWDTFAWSQPAAALLESNVDGRGRSVALLLWCESDILKPVTLHGVTTFYSPQGVKR